MAKDQGDAIEPCGLGAALTDPRLARVINALAARTGATAKDLGIQLGVPDRTMRTYLKDLTERNIVRAVRDQPRGGMKASVLELDPAVFVLDQSLSRALPDLSYRRLRLQTTKSLLGGVSQALASDLLRKRRDDHSFAWTPGVVDERGWRELSVLHRTLTREVRRVENAARARLGSSTSEIVVVGSGVLLVELPSVHK